MKIVLTTSPREGEAVQNYNPQYVLDEFIKYPPLGLLSIVRGIDARHEVTILDSHDVPFDRLLEDILGKQPDLVGISAVTERFYGVVRLAEEIKKHSPRTTIVVGGTHTDLYPVETMRHQAFDFMITGPAEMSFPKFIAWLDQGKTFDIAAIENLYYRTSGGTVIYTGSGDLRNIDSFPLPDRTRLDTRKYVSLSDRHVMTTMTASRGCPRRCRFCNVPRYYMTKSTDRIIDEIEEILSLGFNEIHILDYTFNTSRERVRDICGRIVKKGLKFRWSTRARLRPFDDEMAAAMKEAGCFRLTVGVESHDPAILKYIRKGISIDDIVRGFEILHKYRFESLAYFIVGFPGQTVDQAWSTREFIKTIRPDFVLVNLLLPVAFSDFYNDLVSSGTYQRDYWREHVLSPGRDFTLPSWRGEALDRAFKEVRDGLMKDFYLAPAFVMKEAARDIAGLRFRQLARKIHIGLKMGFNAVRS